jgi:hypothetical protein
MRRALLAVFLTTSCGGVSYQGEIIPRYAIVTTIPEGDPMDRPIEWLVERRRAEVVRFSSLARDGSSVASQLRSIDPAYVAVILRPRDLDANFQLDFLSLCCGLDDDPFPDFAYGYLVAPNADALRDRMKAIEGIEAKVETRLTRVARLRLGAEASAMKGDRLGWAEGVPVDEISVKEGDDEYLHARFAEVEAADFLVLLGDGAPEGVRGLTAADARRLKMGATAVFSGADHTGTAGPGFDASMETVTLRDIPPEVSLAHLLGRGGVSGLFAPLDRTRPALAEAEWANAILSGEPLGWAMKQTYDAAILSRPDGLRGLGRFVVGEKPPDRRDDPVFQSALRVLHGDPLLHPFSRRTVPPIRLIETKEETGPAGGRIYAMRFRVDAPDCAPFFADPFGETQKVHVKIRCSPGTRQAGAAFRSCAVAGVEIPAEVASSALEHWRGETWLHVLVRGKELARRDLTLTLAVTLR